MTWSYGKSLSLRKQPGQRQRREQSWHVHKQQGDHCERRRDWRGSRNQIMWGHIMKRSWNCVLLWWEHADVFNRLTQSYCILKITSTKQWRQNSSDRRLLQPAKYALNWVGLMALQWQNKTEFPWRLISTLSLKPNTKISLRKNFPGSPTFRCHHLTSYTILVRTCIKMYCNYLFTKLLFLVGQIPRTKAETMSSLSL